MPLRRLPCRPARATGDFLDALSTLAAHHPFGETPHPLAASATPLAALHARLLAGLPVFPTAFSAAVASSCRDCLPALHGLAVASGFDAFATVTNSLAAGYAKAGSFPSAARVFATARAWDVSSYNTMVSAIPDSDEALAFAARMLRSGAVRPDAVTFTVALSLAAGRGEAGLVRQLHALASRAGLAADVFVGNALVTAYSRGGSLNAARKVFEEMPARDLVSWNALVCGLAQDGDCPAEVIRVFLRMLKDGAVRPDRISVCSVIPACGGEGRLELGRQIHGFAVKLGIEGHVSIGNVLVAMYYKCGTPGCARKLFEFMDERDVISWTTVISMDGEDAIALLNGMRRDVVAPNEVTFVALLSALPVDCPVREGQMIHAACLKTGLSGKAVVANSLITMYSKLQRMDDARMVFNLTPHPEIIAWNALISGYAQNDKCEDALEVFSSMVKCMKPNETTFASVLSAVTTVETVSMAYGQMYHCQTLKLGLGTSEYVSGALIDLYAKRGSLEESRKAFGETVRRSLIAWTAIISANTKHGNYDSVVNLFNDMVRSGVAPDGVVLLSVLTACRYSGFVSLGREIFDSMTAEHGAELWPEHYACVVDMLGRAGRLEEAEELMMQMPSGPSVSALQSLLGACRIHGNTEVGERVAGVLTETEPAESGAYVLLSNIYAEKGDWGGVARVRRQMRERGVKKEVGFSWVDAGSVGDSLHLHRFSSDDTTHPLTEEIFRVAEGLGWGMKFFKNCLQEEMEEGLT
ncbi:pentatricopeptide repeat-containing protein At4g32430, mitochondrial [Phragmites australis]|uniref:pentatricopeptide repeat-containing protein At4g32430, mitochondrial n=1 Tax=Phragmites australis TaxID=29695 RepID=UPI002D79F2D6|nr:pentatricopeptide repeat-containing protein At4g32430, mitochondrial [Phragmites australis]